MDRTEARRIAAEHNGGHDHPEPGYPLDPTSRDGGHWLYVAHIAHQRGDGWILGWMWRHCPEVPAPGYREHLPDAIDLIGMATRFRDDD